MPLQNNSHAVERNTNDIRSWLHAYTNTGMANEKVGTSTCVFSMDVVRLRNFTESLAMRLI